MSEMSIEHIIHFIQDLIRPPYFLLTRWERETEVHLEIRYLDVSDHVKSTLLHETIHLLHMHTNEEVRERLNEELLAIAAFTQRHSNLLFTLCLLRKTPVQVKFIQKDQVVSDMIIRTSDELTHFVQMMDKMWIRADASDLNMY